MVAFIEPRPNTVTGNKIALLRMRDLKEKGFIDDEELKILDKLEKFWEENPDAEYGIRQEDLSVKPVYKKGLIFNCKQNCK